jgi:thiol-disulfide isomerase/thioredoxin
MALTHTPGPDSNFVCPDFNLLAMDGKSYSLKDFKNNQPLLVMFICNHCPYVKAIEDRLIQLAADLKLLSVNTVGICSNDPNGYPEDSFENLQKRWNQKKYLFPYLHDETQKTAQDFGAVCTPDFFLFDHDLRLQYRGRLDDSWKDPSQVKKRELYEAALALKNRQKIGFKETPSMGCSIKWAR